MCPNTNVESKDAEVPPTFIVKAHSCVVSTEVRERQLLKHKNYILEKHLRELVNENSELDAQVRLLFLRNQKLEKIREKFNKVYDRMLYYQKTRTKMKRCTHGKYIP